MALITNAGPGRPRDPALDEAILQTVREVLIERGYQQLSVQEVTRRCGVHVRTVNRRWSTKPALVAAAVLGGDAPLFVNDEVPVELSGRLHHDLRQLVAANLRFLADPATRAALPALVNEIPIDSEVRERFERRTQEWSATVQSVLEHAVAAGNAPERVLRRGRLLANVIAGTSFTLQWIDPVVDDDEVLDQLTDFVTNGLLA
jgi:AcrR family transcriptional regulator